jgi:hypothetical protein
MRKGLRGGEYRVEGVGNVMEVVRLRMMGLGALLCEVMDYQMVQLEGVPPELIQGKTYQQRL